jgi:hypothetical protein
MCSNRFSAVPLQNGLQRQQLGSQESTDDVIWTLFATLVIRQGGEHYADHMNGCSLLYTPAFQHPLQVHWPGSNAQLYHGPMQLFCELHKGSIRHLLCGVTYSRHGELGPVMPLSAYPTHTLHCTLVSC